MSKSETIVLSVQLHCENCLRKVKKAIAEIDGVESISIDIEQKKVTVVGNVDSSKVLKKVKRTGKHVELLQSGSKKKDEASNKDGEKKKDDPNKRVHENQGQKKVACNDNKKDDGPKNNESAQSTKGKQETPVKKDEGSDIKEKQGTPSVKKDEVFIEHKEKQSVSFPYPQNDMTFMFSEENPNNCSIM